LETSVEDRDRFTVEPLQPRHQRSAFSCGVPALDIYLRQQASQDARRRVAVSFVLTPDGVTIAGYYTLSQHAVSIGDLPETIAKKLPKYPLLPATLIGRLAVSTLFRGRGLGETLLYDALRRCLTGSIQLASIAVVVDAKDLAAAAFYRKHGFIDLPAKPSRLFLPMGMVEKLFR
jgi:ribosomal protein S18 acetylase RimI-like enzyme